MKQALIVISILLMSHLRPALTAQLECQTDDEMIMNGLSRVNYFFGEGHCLPWFI